MLHFPLWKKILVLVVCLAGLIYASPNLLPPNLLPGSGVDRLPLGAPGRQINLGLDLRGGSHLLLQVEMATVISDHMAAIIDDLRRPFAREKIQYRNLNASDGQIRLQLRDATKADLARKIVRDQRNNVTITLEESGQMTIALTPEAERDISRLALQQSIEIIRRRVDETGTREPIIQQQGQNRIIVQLPGVENPEQIKSLLGTTAKLTFHLVDGRNSLAAAQNGRIPAGSLLLPSQDDGDQPILIERRVRVSGESLMSAQPGFQDNQPVVTFRFDNQGGRKFAETTTDNVGRRLAIVLDGEVISAPVINSPIVGGSGIITGNFSVQEVNDLSLLLRAGALPAPLTILEERTVGPGLGKDSIAAGKLAAIIGLLLVAIFMIATYGAFGVMANIALLFNIVLLIALLSAVQATLTLPGIAGIVLTIGMAVDANVLIFERIGEEGRNGRKPFSAVESGYSRALTTIIDSNLTTLIAACLLFAFGSGPIKGFAVTLSFGILTSMFTAIMVTRLMVGAWVRRQNPKILAI